MNPSDLPPRPDRRVAIKWMLAASGVVLAHPRRVFGADVPASAPGAVSASGYGTDPNLMRDYRPGDLWPLTFDDAQRRTAAALCAVIIPADEKSPGAAELGVHDFIDEWISAPYPAQAADRPRVLAALAWVEAQAQQRHARPFAALGESAQQAIIDPVAFRDRVAPEHGEVADAFRKFRDLTAGGFFSTPAGMADLGYVGNVPLASFDGPPPEVIARLGLD